MNCFDKRSVVPNQQTRSHQGQLSVKSGALYLKRATRLRKISVRTLTNGRYLVYTHKSGGSSLTEAYLIPFKGQSHVLRRIAFA
jgi:hypothetical protein